MSTQSLLAEYTYYTDVIYVIFKFGSDKAPKLLSFPFYVSEELLIFHQWWL